jgi:NitT/TauT family transport system substrate-binding protein
MKAKWLITLLIIVLVLAGCSAADDVDLEQPRQVRLILPFQPDVQFAPFYVAMERGYFQEAGLEVSFEHLAENEAVALVGAGEAPFAVVSGEQVLLARAQGLPVVYVMAWWQEYPVAIAVPEGSDIQAPQDLAGRKIGIPGLYGASYIGYRALMSAVGISEGETVLDSIGYSQVEAMLAGQEEAVVIYANNEPVQLAAQGMPMRLFRVADYVHLASNGLIAGEDLIAEDPNLVRAMVAATLQGIEEAIRDPHAAFEISKSFVEGLEDADQAVLQEVLQKTVAFWQADRLGKSNPESWTNMNDILLEMGLLEEAINVEDAYSNEFLP